MKNLLYEKVKVVAGENFITIEDTDELTEHELIEMIEGLNTDPEIGIVEHLKILIHSPVSAEVKETLSHQNFELHDELVFFKQNLDEIIGDEEPFELKSMDEISAEEFKNIWERSMQGSLNAPPSLNMDEQLKSVEKELGPDFRKTCIAAYEGDQAIGVVMPHMEPGTEAEGRIFYFGLVPEARGQKKSVPLYRQGLQALKKQFQATYSVGATSINNKPMLRVFEQTGCIQDKTLFLYKKNV